MSFRILPSQLTETVQLLAKGIVADKAYDRLPILADAIEEGGRTLDRYESQMLRATDFSMYGVRDRVDDILTVLSTETPGTLRAKEVAKADADRLKAFRDSAFAKCGLRGNGYSVKRLMAGITRRRPKGSGSKRDLAQRLEGRLNELATRRWARECKGQRKPTERQLADLMTAVEEAVEAAQVRAQERRISAVDVCIAAVSADNTGGGHRDGGSVTASSYGYSWSTSTVTAERVTGGLVRVVLNRTTRREITAPAKHWVAALSALKPNA